MQTTNDLELLQHINGNTQKIEEGILINRNLNVLNEIPKQVTLDDISYTRVLLSKVYVVAIKSKWKYIVDTLEISNPVFELSDSPELLMKNYNQDNFGFRTAMAITKHLSVLLKSVQDRVPKKIVKEYMRNIELDSIQIHPDKNMVGTFISNSDDFPDGPNFEIKSKLQGTNLQVSSVFKF